MPRISCVETALDDRPVRAVAPIDLAIDRSGIAQDAYDEGMSALEKSYAELAMRLGLRAIRGAVAAPIDVLERPSWQLEAPDGMDVETRVEPHANDIATAPAGTWRDGAVVESPRINSEPEGGSGSAPDVTSMYFDRVPLSEIQASAGLTDAALARRLLLDLLDIELASVHAEAMLRGSVRDQDTIAAVVDEYRRGRSIEQIARSHFMSTVAVGWTLVSEPSRPIADRRAFELDGAHRRNVTASSSSSSVKSSAAEALPATAQRTRGVHADVSADALLASYFAGESLDEIAALRGIGRARLARELLTALTSVSVGFGSRLPDAAEIDAIERSVGPQIVQSMREGVSLRQAASQTGLSLEAAAWFLIARQERLLLLPISSEGDPSGALLRPQGSAVPTRSSDSRLESDAARWVVGSGGDEVARRVVSGFRAGRELEVVADEVSMSAKEALGILIEVLLGLPRDDVRFLRPIESRRFVNASGNEAVAMFDNGAAVSEIATAFDTHAVNVAWAILSHPRALSRFKD